MTKPQLIDAIHEKRHRANQAPGSQCRGRHN